MEIVDKNKAKYVVLRNEKKTSDEEMSLEDATKELERWQTVIKRWPDGSKLRIEQVKR